MDRDGLQLFLLGNPQHGKIKHEHEKTIATARDKTCPSEYACTFQQRMVGEASDVTLGIAKCPRGAARGAAPNRRNTPAAAAPSSVTAAGRALPRRLTTIMHDRRSRSTTTGPRTRGVQASLQRVLIPGSAPKNCARYLNNVGPGRRV
jgi:hypothetical protein